VSNEKTRPAPARSTRKKRRQKKRGSLKFVKTPSLGSEICELPRDAPDECHSRQPGGKGASEAKTSSPYTFPESESAGSAFCA